MIRIRMRTFVIFGVAALSGALLLHTSQAVQEAEGRLARLSSEVVQEHDALQVLEAEWVYLNSPARLEQLSAQYLDLVPPRTKQISVMGEGLPVSVRASSRPDVLHYIASDVALPEDVPMPRRKPLNAQERFDSLLFRPADDGGAR